MTGLLAGRLALGRCLGQAGEDLPDELPDGTSV
jgi:hypothetical protein